MPASYSVVNTYIRQRLRHVPALELTLWMLVVGGLALLPLAAVLPTERIDATRGVALEQAVASLVALGIFGTGLAIAVFNKLIQEQGPLFAGMVTYVIPVGALIWAWVDGEHITRMQLLALSGIFLMVAIVQYKAAHREPTREVVEAP